MTSDLQVFGARAVAEMLSIEESSVRRLAIKMNAEGKTVGRKLNARAWLFTVEDVEMLKKRDDRRGDWQKDGGRKSYLEKKVQQNMSLSTRRE